MSVAQGIAKETFKGKFKLLLVPLVKVKVCHFNQDYQELKI